MTSESRIDRLERELGHQDATPRPAIVVYDPSEAPKDPDERDAWLLSRRPSGTAVVFFIPDNGRGSVL